MPAIRDLDAVVRDPGAGNDLIGPRRRRCRRPPRAPSATATIGGGDLDCAGVGPDDDEFGDGAFDESACALRNSLDQLVFLRAYTPELLGWINDFGSSGTMDANGGIGRIARRLQHLLASPAAGLPDVSLAPAGLERAARGADPRPEQPLPGLAGARSRRWLDALHRGRHPELRPDPGSPGAMRRIATIAVALAAGAGPARLRRRRRRLAHATGSSSTTRSASPRAPTCASRASTSAR